MIRWFFLTVLTLSPIAAWADTALHSQTRGENETFEAAVEAYRERVRGTRQDFTDAGKTALDSAVPVSMLDFYGVPDYGDYASAKRMFESIRDERFLYSTSGSAPTPRRISWLYPDDGCYTRSALVSRLIGDWKQAKPAKIFVFGNLQVFTKNAAAGSVRWWYHVSSAVYIEEPGTGKREYFVLDPAISPKFPLRLNDWFGQMNPNIQTLKAAFCEPNTYVPSQQCRGDVGNWDGEAAGLQQSMFLPAEERRLRELGRDPVQELGENPPWKF